MSASIDALWFDGRQARARAVRVHVEDEDLVAQGEAAQRWPLRGVQWPERTRHGRRVAHLPGGGSLQFDDAASFDAWRQAHGGRNPWVVRTQQHWGRVFAAMVALVAVLAASWVWGIPLAARGVVALVPQDVDRAVGNIAFDSMARRWLKPSALPEARQARLRAAFTQAVEAAYAQGDRPAWTLQFAAASKELGPNAFALPGGRIVLTDAMVELLADHEDTLVGVLGHEFGHVRERHGMRGLVQATLVGALASAAIGDFSTLLAGAPAVLAQMAYSRDFERDADSEAVHLLRAAGLPPAAMVVLFEKLQSVRAGREGAADLLPIALASHPADEERVRFFREAARR